MRGSAGPIARVRSSSPFDRISVFVVGVMFGGIAVVSLFGDAANGVVRIGIARRQAPAPIRDSIVRSDARRDRVRRDEICTLRIIQSVLRREAAGRAESGTVRVDLRKIPRVRNGMFR